MGRFTIALIAVGLTFVSVPEGRMQGGRTILQAPAPAPTTSTSVAAPVGTTILQKFRGIGTQNYTAQPTGTYSNTGAKAKLYFYTAPFTQGALHYFDSLAEPTFVFLDPYTGRQTGLVHGKVLVRQPTTSQPNDGGFGSVPALLLQAFGGEGILARVTYIQRLNVTGGVAPPALFTLPSWNGIPDAELAIPYQADYIFLEGGLSPTASGGK